MNDYFKKINKTALSEIRTTIDEIRNGSTRGLQRKKAQELTERDYRGRYLYELIQNAVDSFVENKGKIKIVVKDRKLICCNTGTPITDHNFAGLCAYADSSKINDSSAIGNKGIGKASYYEISEENHGFFSRASCNSTKIDGYCFELASSRIEEYCKVICSRDFSEKSTCPFDSDMPILESRTPDYISSLKEKDPDTEARRSDLNSIKCNLPIPAYISDEIAEIMAGYSTAVVLPIKPDEYDNVNRKIESFIKETPEILLFLPSIEALEIIDSCNMKYLFTQTREIYHASERRYDVKITCLTPEEEHDRKFIFWKYSATPEEEKKAEELNDKAHVRKNYDFEFAIELGSPDISGHYYCGLPTEHKTGVHVHINANFYLKSDRKSIDLGHKYNNFLLEISARHAREIIAEIKKDNDGIPNEKNANLIMGFLAPVSFEDSYFCDMLHKQINELPSFESIFCSNSDKWHSPKEVYPRLEKKDFGDFITTDMFHKYCNSKVLDESINTKHVRSFIKKIDADFQNRRIDDNEILNVLTEIADDIKDPQKELSEFWTDVINHWNKYIELNENEKSGLKYKKIFLGKDNLLYSYDHVYLNKETLIIPSKKDKLPFQYPFMLLSKGLNKIFSKNEIASKIKIFLSPDELNIKFYEQLIEHLNTQNEEHCYENNIFLFRFIINKFSPILKSKPSLLKKLLFPAKNKNWYPLCEFYQGNGWGQKHDDEELDIFEKYFSFDKKLVASISDKCLPGPNSKIWKGIVGIKELVNGHLNALQFFDFHPISGEIIVVKNSIRITKMKNIPSEIEKDYIAYLESKDWYEEVKMVTKLKMARRTIDTTFTCKSQETRWIKRANNNSLTKDQKNAFYKIIQNHAKEISEDMKIKFEISRNEKDLFEPYSPLAFLLKRDNWIPANGDFLSPKQIKVCSEEITRTYPFLISLNIFDHKDIPSDLWEFIKKLGAKEISNLNDIEFKELSVLFEKGKQQEKYKINKLLDKKWEALLKEDRFVLPEYVICQENDGTYCTIKSESKRFYVPDIPDSKEYKEKYSPYLSISTEIAIALKEKLSGDPHSNIIFFGDLRGTPYIDRVPLAEFEHDKTMPLIEIHDVLLATLLLTISKEDAEEKFVKKICEMRFYEATSIELHIDGKKIPKQFLFENNILILSASNGKWNQAFSKAWTTTVDKSISEDRLIRILDNIDRQWNEAHIVKTLLDVSPDDYHLAEKRFQDTYDRLKNINNDFCSEPNKKGMDNNESVRNKELDSDNSSESNTEHAKEYLAIKEIIIDPLKQRPYPNPSNRKDHSNNKNSNMETQDECKKIGEDGENLAYEYLCNKYKEPYTIEKKSGEDDAFGCDFIINSPDGGKIYYECKATKGNDRKFVLGSSEIRKAKACLDTNEKYYILIIRNLYGKPIPEMLENPFIKNKDGSYSMKLTLCNAEFEYRES